MKHCSECGREINDEARLCDDCGAKLLDGTAIRLSLLELHFDFTEGFSRPDWKAVHSFINGHIPEEERAAAWRFAAKKWLEQLAKDLGGDSAVHESEHFLCMSDLNSEMTQSLLAYAESVLGTIRSFLKEAAWTGFHGKHVLLLFSDLDDYYTYISYFYPEGSHILSAGVFLKQDYVHVAVSFMDIHSAKRILVHELVHNLLCHLRIPKWLNEGLAIIIENRVTQRRFLVTHELAESHAKFWNDANIQSFWSGKSFGVPGEESKLSYSLALILLTLLSQKGGEFTNFIKLADWRDAGQAAALAILGLNLGDLAGEFLGPGNWRPQRKAIVDQWKRNQEKHRP